LPKGILWALVRDCEALLERVPARFDTVRAHHVTLRFGADLGPYQRLMGRVFEARVTAEAWNDVVQAVRVELPPPFDRICENLHPHVTISTRGETPAKASKPLLEAPARTRPLDFAIRLKVDAERW
jgi:hypothetical protein